MPRRSRRARDTEPSAGTARAQPPARAPRELPIVLDSGEHCEGAIEIRTVARHQATKVYRCPGCDLEIAIGLAHVVVVPQEDPSARRHWHARCWTRERTDRESAFRRRRA